MIYYILGISVLLLVYVFYLQVCSLRWNESERRALEQVELRLAHILRLLEAPDVRMLMDNPKKRQDLFLQFSRLLREDVADLLRLRALGFKAVAFAGLFFASYYLLRLKVHLFCGRDDLRFLSRLELALFRNLE
ncbi:MAG TPA: hypothetical protein VGQ81_15320 [Acidobacteriota bacterium]|jgi:hypothetical protein|nr:hypothetical protein [Acidobacteriota bacterium]